MPPSDVLCLVLPSRVYPHTDTPIDTSLGFEAQLNISLLWCIQASTRNIEGALKELFLTLFYLLILTSDVWKLGTRQEKSPKAGEISQDMPGSVGWSAQGHLLGLKPGCHRFPVGPVQWLPAVPGCLRYHWESTPGFGASMGPPQLSMATTQS